MKDRFVVGRAERQSLMERANRDGIPVKLRDGSVMRGTVSGVANPFASVVVRTALGDLSYEYSWATIREVLDSGRELQ